METDDQQQEHDEQAAADDREWKPEACFMAIDVEYGGNLVDLTSNMTRGALEKTPGQESMWRVPHYVKVRGGGGSGGVWVAGYSGHGCLGRGMCWPRSILVSGVFGAQGMWVSEEDDEFQLSVYALWSRSTIEVVHFC